MDNLNERHPFTTPPARSTCQRSTGWSADVRTMFSVPFVAPVMAVAASATPAHRGRPNNSRKVSSTLQVHGLNDFRGHDFWLGHVCFGGADASDMGRPPLFRAQSARNNFWLYFAFLPIFRVFLKMCVTLSACLSVCRSVYQSVSLSLCLPISPSARPCAYVAHIYPSIRFLHTPWRMRNPGLCFPPGRDRARLCELGRVRVRVVRRVWRI